MAETKHIVRLMGQDLPGMKTIENALRKIRGISFMTARAVRIKSGFSTSLKIGDLTDSQIDTISNILEHPHDFKWPLWLMNRRKDPLTGIDSHLTQADLMLANRADIDTMKKIKVYRGIRHMFNLPVRGQRTRSTGRKNRTVGVARKKSGPQAGGGKK